MRRCQHCTSIRSLALVAAMLGLSAVAAQAQSPGGATGDLSYARSSGSGGYAANNLTVNVEPTAMPLALGFNAIQSLVDGQEVSTQAGASVSWRIAPAWSVAAQLSATNDDLLNVNARGFAVTWNLHKLWQGRRTTRLELERTVSDYSLQKGVQNLNDRIPQQRRTHLEVRQGVTETFDVYASLDTYDYSQDPVDLARALLNRKVRRVAAAGMLGDLAERGQTLGVSWSLAEDWALDASTGQGNTVVGQNQRQGSLALTYLFHPRASASLTWSTSHADALTGPSGSVLAPAQSDSTVELGLRWLF